eukprot:CAMPEP_0177277812 /NCGR_PEP_ID=MMETSP0367-20130122/68988_1 /TAXON_ID=447022 ORGANISM="Scrippsiella hangoei-like, Strain SHHI-4" /NCGR_SAMPLE_ID=MMETSP0367 /ASSEMBLY_ACC=CAM_ASM_000362 /LENGTH=477 /DNA_ID=CAMNT_0018734415 /DNA_START=53 /DNA_END=1486 /DNA_ORIENTATION=+
MTAFLNARETDWSPSRSSGTPLAAATGLSEACQQLSPTALRLGRAIPSTLGLGLASSVLFRSQGKLQDSQVGIATYWVDNTRLQAKTCGLGFRLTKTVCDLDRGEVAPWASLIDGVDSGDGWVSVGARFLPTHVHGVHVLKRRDYQACPRPQLPMGRTWSNCSTHCEHWGDPSSPSSGPPELVCEEAEHKIRSRGSSDEGEEHWEARSLWARAHRIGKPDAKCEDAFFLSSSAVGVADGVGGMAEYSEYGVDAAAYATELMELMETVLRAPGVTSCQAIASAELQAQSFGASTAMVARLAGATLDVAGLGDSGFMLLRRGRDKEAGRCRWRIVGRSREQQHSWNFPFQLARIPEELEADVVYDCPRDSAEGCLRYEFPVERGDLALLFTDGFSDNLFDEEVVHIVEGLLNEDGDIVDPDVVAKELATRAYVRSRDSMSQTPWSESARKHGQVRFGGKIDDITVVAAWVADEDSNSFD